MYPKFFAATCLTIVMAASAPSLAIAPKSHSLFDGKSFAGWEGDTTKTWRIEGGAIVGGSLKEVVPHNDFLCTTKEYSNFDLSLKFKLVGSGFVNGGIQIRSRRTKSPAYEMSGYQADMGDGYWGSLYDESRRNKTLAGPTAEQQKRLLKPNDWNDYRIRAVGSHIELWLNGERTVDFTETDPSLAQTGLIGVQIHGGGKAEASYKDLVIRELPFAAPKPVTAIRIVTETLHGIAISDPYKWLENQESPETREWIAAQNAWTDSHLGTISMTRSLEKRIGQLLRNDRYSIPIAAGGRYFYSLQRPKDDQTILYVRDSANGKGRVLVDPHPLSKDHTTSVDFAAISTDGKLAAYTIRQGGDDQVEVHFMDPATGKELPDRLPKSFSSGINIKPDRSGFYYTRLTPLVGRRVLYHAMGTDSSQDKIIFGENTNAEVFPGASVSEDGKWLVLSTYYGWNKNDTYLKNLTNDGPIQPLVVGLDAITEVTPVGDRLIARTDYKSPNRRIVEIDIKNPEPSKWRDLVPATSDAIESWSLAAGKLFVHRLHDVSAQISVYGTDGKFERELVLPGLGSSGAPNGLFAGTEAFYFYQSFTAPPTIYRYDSFSQTSTVWAQSGISINGADFETKQVFVTSKDGAQVPMYLVQKAGLEWDGKRPTALLGYGGFNSSETPYFSSRAIVWAEHGGVLAVANLRGGGEYGESWHRAGMGAKKQNVFDDFIACAEWLILNKVTNPSQLGIEGGSNGGLLVGAALTLRPDLFQVVICEVPLLDMVVYHRFMQGPQWVPEYGSSDDAQQFKTLFAYSPYHHVKPGTKYPAVLFETGDGDTRVAPLHARKMTALLQAATGSERPILLHYDIVAGHSAGEPISKTISDTARKIAFMLWQMGMK